MKRMNEKDYEEYVLVMKQAREAELHGYAVLDAHWANLKGVINHYFNGIAEDEAFLNTIWEVSSHHLDGKEVSVIVDRDDNLFISKGTGSFVDYESESVSGMKIPLKCWIHTHPFGVAYFSDTDWGTINAQMPILDSAIVLGNKERMKWWKSGGKQCLSKTNQITLDDSEE